MEDAPGSPLKVVALGLLGYVYAIGVFLGLLAVGFGTILLLPSPGVALWVTIPLALVAVGVFRAVWSGARSPRESGSRRTGTPSYSSACAG